MNFLLLECNSVSENYKTDKPKVWSQPVNDRHSTISDCTKTDQYHTVPALYNTCPILDPVLHARATKPPAFWYKLLAT